MAIQQNDDGTYTRYGEKNAPIKRKISIYEKSSVINTSGFAATLAGQGWCEYDELKQVGFHESKIYGFECDNKIRSFLRKEYPYNLIKDGLIQDRLVRIFDYNEISYLHLDYEQALISGTGGINSYGNIFFRQHPMYPHSQRRFSDLFGDGARLRITACAKPRGNPMGAAVWSKNIAYYLFLQACTVHNVDNELVNDVGDHIDQFFQPIESLCFKDLRSYQSQLTTKESFAHINFAMFLFMYFAMPQIPTRRYMLNMDIKEISECKALVESYDEVQSITNLKNVFYRKTDTQRANGMFTGWCDVGTNKVPFNEFLTTLSEYIIGQQSECILAKL